ncbi:hypothetical protein O4D10_02140 [Xanthomonas citri pv. citri]|uniref:hypothetical protein n=1 Tax=Xanthomonas citri TaxID=346 RepID=UPI0036DBD3D4
MPVQIALCSREILTVHLLWRNILSSYFLMKCCGGPLARCARLALAHLHLAPSMIVAQVRSTYGVQVTGLWVNDSPAKPEANSCAMWEADMDGGGQLPPQAYGESMWVDQGLLFRLLVGLSIERGQWVIFAEQEPRACPLSNLLDPA